MLPGKTVLVVDDDPDILESVTDLLGSEGYRCVTARNGAEALERVAELQPPYVILLDLLMAIMDGRRFIQELKKMNLATPDRPLVVMSASYEALETVKHLGVTAMIEKPFDLEHILEVIARAWPTQQAG